MRTKEKLRPLKSIREKCMDCCCENPKSIMGCPCTDCTLWLWRFGKRPESIKKKRPLLVDSAFFDSNIDLKQTQMIKKIKKLKYGR